MKSKVILITILLIVSLSLLGCTQSQDQAQKSYCPSECCTGQPQFYDSICAGGKTCVNNKCVSSTTSANSDTQNNNAQQAAPSNSTDHKIGEKISLGELSYTVNSIDQMDALGSEYVNKTTEGMFYVVEVTIENNSTSEKNITPTNDFVVIDEKNRTYKPDLMLGVYAKTSGLEPLEIIEKLQAGIPKTGVIVFELPKETKGKLKIKPSLFSGEALVEFK